MNARWLAITTLILATHMTVPAARAEEKVEGHCFGLLWCTDREGDHISREGLLWLYSSEERGPYSRLTIRPFYSEELDPTKDLLRRSILWPLGTYERTGATISSRVVPFYWHGEGHRRHYTLIPPLYFDHAEGDHASTYLLPFYVHRAQGGYYHQRFFLGPLLILTEDAHHDLDRWDFLFPLAGHSSYADGADTWLAPLYFSGHQDSTGRNYRFLLPLYGQSQSPGSHFRFLFPLLGSTQDETGQLHRFSLLGFPPLPTSPTLPALALYEHVMASDRMSHRFFPLYNFEEDRTRSARDLSIVGFRQWSVFRYADDLTSTEHHILGLYGYSRDMQDDSRDLGILGYGGLSFFRYHDTASALAHRLFPLYRYRHDRVADEAQFDGLLLYRHLTTPTQTADRLLPLWDYESAREKHDWRISAIGLYPLALIHHQSNDEVTANHVFPIYGYRNSETEGSRLSLIGFPPSSTVTWAWYTQERRPTFMTARLFPLFEYINNDQTHEREWDAIGINPVTLFQYRAAPDRTENRLLPFYGYRRDRENRRFTGLGLPPSGESPALSLLEVVDGPILSAHRFTPLYAYSHDHARGEVSFNALSLYWYNGSQHASRHSALLLGSLRADDAKHEWGFTLFGLDPVVPVSLARHTVSPTEARSLLFPLYDYRRDGSDTSFTFGGFSELSLFRHQSTSIMTRHRFFPIYDYSRDRQRQSTALNAMLLYRDESSPTQTSKRLIPLWSYDANRATGETRLGIAGWAPFSLYQAVTTPTQRSRRLFPVYTHLTDLTTGRGETDVLWPLFNVKSQDAEMTEWSALWWLAHYEKPTSESYEFRLLGGSRLALLRWAASAERSSFELNPVLPLYRYSAEREKGTAWDLLGGLVGVETGEEGRTRLRVFWMRI